MDEQELFDIREHVAGQMDRVIIDLYETMMQYDKNDILENAAIEALLIGKIAAAYDGLKKASSILEFLDAWDENGEIPSFHFGTEEDIPIVRFSGGNHD